MKYRIFQEIINGIVDGNNDVIYDKVNIYVYSGLCRSIEPQKVCYDAGRFAIHFTDQFGKPATTYLYVEDIKDISYSESENSVKFVFSDEGADSYGNGRDTFIEFFLDNLKNL